MTFTNKDKRQAIEREIALRMNVYQRKVETGSMKKSRADYEIAVMQAIREDYLQKEEGKAETMWSELLRWADTDGTPSGYTNSKMRQMMEEGK